MNEWKFDLVSSFTHIKSLEEMVKEKQDEGFDFYQMTERFIVFKKITTEEKPNVIDATTSFSNRSKGNRSK